MFNLCGREEAMEEKAHGEHPCFSLILVHVGVGQRCRTRAPDVESPATLPTMSARNVPAGFVRREAKERRNVTQSKGEHAP